MQGLAQQIKEIINETCSEVLEKIELEEKEIDLMVAGLNLLEVQRKRGQDASVHAPFGEVEGTLTSWRVSLQNLLLTSLSVLRSHYLMLLHPIANLISSVKCEGRLI